MLVKIHWEYRKFFSAIRKNLHFIINKEEDAESPERLVVLRRRERVAQDAKQFSRKFSPTFSQKLWRQSAH